MGSWCRVFVCLFVWFFFADDLVIADLGIGAFLSFGGKRKKQNSLAFRHFSIPMRTAFGPEKLSPNRTNHSQNPPETCIFLEPDSIAPDLAIGAFPHVDPFLLLSRSFFDVSYTKSVPFDPKPASKPAISPPKPPKKHALKPPPRRPSSAACWRTCATTGARCWLRQRACMRLRRSGCRRRCSGRRRDRRMGGFGCEMNVLEAIFGCSRSVLLWNQSKNERKQAT
jgi:hypothetical protein